MSCHEATKATAKGGGKRGGGRQLTCVLVSLGGTFRGVDSSSQHGIGAGNACVEALVMDGLDVVLLCPVEQVMFINLYTFIDWLILIQC